MQSKFCTGCGATLAAGTTFCTGCGQRTDAAAPAPAPAPAYQPPPPPAYQPPPAQAAPPPVPAGPHPEYGKLLARSSGLPLITLIYNIVYAGTAFILMLILIFTNARTSVGAFGFRVTTWSVGLILLYICLFLLVSGYAAYKLICGLKSEVLIYERGVTGVGSHPIIPLMLKYSYSYEDGVIPILSAINPDKITLIAQPHIRSVHVKDAKVLAEELIKAQKK